MQAGTLGNATGPSITGNVTSTAVRTITLADTIATSDVSITAKITGAAGITTAGTGRLDLNPAVASDYTGNVSVGRKHDRAGQHSVGFGRRSR